MKIINNCKDEKRKLERIYIAAATLKNFRGQELAEVQLFRPIANEAEIEPLRGKGYVGEPDISMPKELLTGATEDAALSCLLEAFTKEEIERIIEYLQKRYANVIDTLSIGKMDMPVPLGIGPLGALPAGENSGFIHFDNAPDYPLNFSFKGYYDLNS